MDKALILKSSILEKHSQSNKMVDYFIKKWLNNHLDSSVTVRDLTKNTVPVLDNELMNALFSNNIELTERQKEALDLSNTLITELNTHDLIVIAVPMYNFNVPTQLKNYFDFIIRAGITFRYTESGPQGLIKGKKAIILTTRGGIHKDSSSDLLTPYIKLILNFIGIIDIEFIFAEGLSLGDNSTNQSQENARNIIDQISI
ncbi:FMN-dependent NADH-azoreductase [Xenorhabdus sp. DI]|uniref:FMN-dependent NADH-azoreductase n=1 Tax=Xenorhabdus doucetiae TaxID=351671 RepID=UPI001988C86B|nr:MULTISPECIES: FMN-dependent NADH-azoreductase [unclassified Xenorhabdus]MBD2784936.1 FMN-dependent NADH-azoreductase [Xenorhabdus sp. 3]MBD2789215.1 FMN-dependent NADH-azoreductase [Xenorhabdus sp. DI]